jgi:hypothetical protein
MAELCFLGDNEPGLSNVKSELLVKKAQGQLVLAISLFLLLLSAETVGQQSNQREFDYKNYTGNQLFADCTSGDFQREGFCLVLIGDLIFAQRGLAPLSPRKADGSPYLPPGGDLGQMKDIVVKDLRENPETRHENYLFLIVKTILRTQPSCRLPT